MRILRSSEWLLVGYFLYAAATAWWLDLRPPIAAITMVVNLSVIAGLFLLAHAHRLRDSYVLGILRDWYPLPLLLLGYREMGWFAKPHTGIDLELAWVVWDRRLLNEWGLKAAIESLGPVLPSVLEISYSLVYAITTFSLGVLYAYRRRRLIDRFLFTVLLAVLLAYAMFPFFPSEPPRTVFPGEDFPSRETVFRRFNWWLLEGYGIHTSVFPSAHVALAYSAAFAMVYLLGDRKWVGGLLLVLATLIAVATVYGRYHFAVDAVAGFGLAVLALAVTMARGRRPSGG